MLAHEVKQKDLMSTASSSQLGTGKTDTKHIGKTASTIEVDSLKQSRQSVFSKFSSTTKQSRGSVVDQPGILEQNGSIIIIKFKAQFKDKFGMKFERNKVVIVAPDTQAFEFGVRPGWIVTKVRGKRVDPNVRSTDKRGPAGMIGEACRKFYTVPIEFEIPAPSSCCVVS
mmetsp:Transcript_29802/g.41545  ORF Transcript_29802/g.41545 Transcript_29802/m.41545 type:complete len:170 (-) Transcript_29802:329-838(-)